MYIVETVVVVYNRPVTVDLSKVSVMTFQEVETDWAEMSFVLPAYHCLMTGLRNLYLCRTRTTTAK